MESMRKQPDLFAYSLDGCGVNWHGMTFWSLSWDPECARADLSVQPFWLICGWQRRHDQVNRFCPHQDGHKVESPGCISRCDVVHAQLHEYGYGSKACRRGRCHRPQCSNAFGTSCYALQHGEHEELARTGIFCVHLQGRASICASKE